MTFNPYADVEPSSPPFSPQPPLSPNRAVKEKNPYRTNTSELKTLPTLPSQPTPTHEIGYYPASLCVLVVWIVFVILLLWLLESAVRHGPQSLSQPWAYTTLPGLLITVFAQGHGAITAMHLSRVSVSALHSARTSPSTWAEVFWISDRAWQGPVGMLSTFLAASRLRVRTSTHFILCAVTCLTALVTPIILSRAYPIRTITVDEDTTITPFALSTERMGALDAYGEIATGSGAWTTALSVSETYNSSVYLPPGASRNDDPLDFFFGGNVQGKTARLPGLRLSGHAGDQGQSYTQPSLEEMATGFWRGVSYNVAGLGLLSRANDTSYAAVQSGQTAVYVRQRDFAASAYALLAVWLLPTRGDHSAQLQADVWGQLRQLYHCKACAG
ncbi:hypothetical protein MVEN_02629400 [Mycena venus]|uniref:Uncharacterized protein n=1 Tax=Mycena venus TaxID=2733690 RepID=A0A8H6TU38_9AGAR|nr:hypothetical protein MVEN_02629400 [Mycena venus]